MAFPSMPRPLRLSLREVFTLIKSGDRFPSTVIEELCGLVRTELFLSPDDLVCIVRSARPTMSCEQWNEFVRKMLPVLKTD